MNYQYKLNKYNSKKQMTSNPDKIKLYNDKINYYKNFMIGGGNLVLDEKEYIELPEEEKNKYEWVQKFVQCKKYFGMSKEDMIKQKQSENLYRQNIIKQLVQKMSTNQNQVILTPDEYNILYYEPSLIQYKNQYNWVKNESGPQYDRYVQNYTGTHITTETKEMKLIKELEVQKQNLKNKILDFINSDAKSITLTYREDSLLWDLNEIDRNKFTFVKVPSSDKNYPNYIMTKK